MSNLTPEQTAAYEELPLAGWAYSHKHSIRALKELEQIGLVISKIDDGRIVYRRLKGSELKNGDYIFND